MIDILAAPFAACIVIAALHCYMGLHVVRRGVIFVDLALAQVAALGSAVALLLAPVLFSPADEHVHETTVEFSEPAELSAADFAFDEEEADSREKVFGYGLSLLFAFLGAGLFALGRFRDGEVPHEAIIGIVYVVSAALAMLVLNKAPHGLEEMEAMLLGSILFVGWNDVIVTALLYGAIAALHFLWRRRFLRISLDAARAESEGLNVRLWDFVFYVLFGLMVTQSVRIGGVLVVFSFLIIPAVCATMLIASFRRRLFFAWTIALIGSILGLWFSAAVDMPTGSSLVAALGLALVVCSVVNRFRPAHVPIRR